MEPRPGQCYLRRSRLVPDLRTDAILAEFTIAGSGHVYPDPRHLLKARRQMSNDQDPEAAIRALGQLEARAKARIGRWRRSRRLKAKDAGVAEAEAAARPLRRRGPQRPPPQRAAEEAARIRAEEEAAAARGGGEPAAADRAAALRPSSRRSRRSRRRRIASRKQAEADRAARLEAEVAALKAKEAEQARAAAAAASMPAPVAASVPPAAAQPQVVYVDAPAKPKKGGLIAALLVLILALAGTLGATYLAIRGDLRWRPAPVPTDVVLIGGRRRPRVAKTATFPRDLRRSASTTGTALSPSRASLSPRSPRHPRDLRACMRDARIDPAAEKRPDCRRLHRRPNTDETLPRPGAHPGRPRRLPAEPRLGHLLADTGDLQRLLGGATFRSGRAAEGTLVGYDRFGVPRLHCGSLVALTAPVAGGARRGSSAAPGATSTSPRS